MNEIILLAPHNKEVEVILHSLYKAELLRIEHIQQPSRNILFQYPPHSIEEVPWLSHNNLQPYRNI